MPHSASFYIGVPSPLIAQLPANRFRAHISQVQCTIVNIFLPIIFNISFGCSKEPSHCAPTTYVLMEKLLHA